jgi:arylsulfatase A-like enzyme
VAPTLLEAAGVEPQTAPFGRSFLPVLAGRAGLERAEAFMESTARDKEIRGVRTGTSKVVLDVKTGERTAWDLEADPREREPVAGAAGFEDASRRLDTWLEETRRLSGAERDGQDRVDEETLRKLRELGYVQ